MLPSRSRSASLTCARMDVPVGRWFQKNCRRKKLDDKATFGIFVGYSPTSKAYRILDPESGRVGVATSVVFDETVMVVDGPGSTPATAGGSAPSAVTRVYTHPAPDISAADDSAVIPALEPPVVAAPVIESGAVVVEDAVSVAPDLDGVHASAPGSRVRRSARIRDLARSADNAFLPADTPPLSTGLSTPTPPDVSAPGQSWAVQSIVGYQLRRERDEYGTPAAQLTDHYKVRWVGDWDDT